MATATLPISNFSQKTDSQQLIIPYNEIVKLLPMFKPDCIYLHHARLHQGVLHCSFGTFEYPYSVKPIKHLTREHALLFVTQACYLLSVLLSKCDPRWPINSDATLALAENEQMLFSDIHLHFSKLIPNRDGIDLQLALCNLRIIRNRMFAKLDFVFPAGCSGYCRAIIALDGSFDVQTHLSEANATIK